MENLDTKIRLLAEMVHHERTIFMLKGLVCFDALRAGYCEHHGGKCSDILEKTVELQHKIGQLDEQVALLNATA